MGYFVVGLKCKAYQALVFTFGLAQCSRNVVRRFQPQHQIFLFTFDLVVGRTFRRKVSHGSTKDSCIGICIGCSCCLIHFLSAFHIDAVYVRVVNLKADRSADESDFCTPSGADFCQCISHLSGRIVADETYRIDFFVCRAGCDHNLASFQVFLACKESFKNFNDFFRFFHSSFSYEMTGQFPGSWFDDVVPVRAENIEIMLG